MATFGAIASAAPNVLFDPARVDAQVQGFQRNQLLMQNAQQDQQQQSYQRDTEARIGLARQLVGMPEDQAAAAWGTERQRLQAAGFGRDLPEQFPGLERLRSVAASDLTTFQRLQIDQRNQASAALMGALGGIVGGGAAPMGQAPAMPASMPSAGGSPYAGLPPPAGGAAAAPPGVYQGGNGGAAVRADNVTAGAARDRIIADDSLTPEQREEALRGVTMGRVGALKGRPVAGGGQAPAQPASAPVQPQGGGLTPQQRALIAAQAAANPQGAIAMAGQFAQQNAMAQERAGDNQRAERQFTAQQTQQAEANRRADEALRLQQEGVRRQETTAQTAARTAEQGRLATITQQEAPQLEKIGSASGIIANGKRLLGLIDSGGISFATGASAAGAVRGFFNDSNESDRNREDLRRHVTESVNAILSQASGPQTDQDAARARDQILNNLTDKEQVKRGLASLNGAMERARQIAATRLQSRRRELGLPEADLSPYTNVAANITEGGGATTGGTQSAPQGGGWSIRPVQ